MASAVPPPDSLQRYGLDRRYWLSVLIITLLMCWPLLLEGRPPYFEDSVSSQKGGEFAVNFARKKIEGVLHIGQPEPPAAATPPLPAKPQSAAGATSATPAPASAASSSVNANVSSGEGVKAMRSVTYSLLSYLLRWPGHSMVLLAISQAIAISLIIAAYLKIFGDGSLRTSLLVGAALAFLTPAALNAMFAMPDIYAGIMIGAIALLAAASGQLSRMMKCMLVVLAAASVTFHASHPPVALAVTLIALFAIFIVKDRPLKRALPDTAWLLVPLLIGMGTSILIGKVAVGEASVVPKRYPLVLVRSIMDGPARVYLRDHCHEKHYAICEIYPGELPKTVEEMLWAPNGLKGATTEQLDRVRAQESEIVLHAALEHPFLQIRQNLVNILRQLLAFDFQHIRFNTIITPDASGTLVLKYVKVAPHPSAQTVAFIGKITVALSCIFLFLQLRRVGPSMRVLFLVVIGGVFANAVICAVFSGVANRYQSRVIWLLPLLAVCAYYASRKRAASTAS